MKSKKTIVLEIIAFLITWFLAISGVEPTNNPENQLIS
jgi:hypothetical protein